MKKQSLIRVLLIVIIVTAAAFVVAATHTGRPASDKETCTQQEGNECVEKKSSEFLLESLTRSLLSR